MKRPDNIMYLISANIEIYLVNMSVSSLCCVSVSTQSFVQPVRTDSIKQAERGRVTLNPVNLLRLIIQHRD